MDQSKRFWMSMPDRIGFNAYTDYTFMIYARDSFILSLGLRVRPDYERSDNDDYV